MPYQIEECSNDPGQNREIAEFLACFVRDGETEGTEEDREPETWRNRLDWWWDANPYCREDSPRGFVLREDGGEVVGFYGLIPHDYLCDGELVPSLVSTTSFVRAKSRSAALPLFLRAHRLKNQYQLIDGGPNDEARALVDRLGYQHDPPATVLMYPFRRRSLHPKSLLLQLGRLGAPGPSRRGEQDGYAVSDLERVKFVPTISKTRMTKRIDRSMLEWYLQVGTEKKVFAGWCDSEGSLRAYLIATPWKKWGQDTMVVIDYGVFDPDDDEILDSLAARLAADPDTFRVPSEASLLVWPVSSMQGRHRIPWYRMKKDARLYYHLPGQWESVERESVPFEGDRVFW